MMEVETAAGAMSPPASSSPADSATQTRAEREDDASSSPTRTTPTKHDVVTGADASAELSVTSATTTTAPTSELGAGGGDDENESPSFSKNEEEEGTSSNKARDEDPNDVVEEEVSDRPAPAAASRRSSKQVQFNPEDLASASSSSTSPLRKESNESFPSVVSALTDTEPDTVSATPITIEAVVEDGGDNGIDDDLDPSDARNKDVGQDLPRGESTPTPPPRYGEWVSALSSASASESESGTGAGVVIEALHARACRLAKGNRAAASSLLLSASNLLDGAAKALQMAALGAVPSTASTSPSSATMNVKLVVGELQAWTSQTGRQYGKLAGAIGSAAKPLPSYGAVQIDALAGMDQRLRQARQACRDVTSTGAGTEPLSPGTPRPSNDTTFPPVADVLQRLEQMVLEQLLLLEMDRVKVFGPALHGALTAAKQCLDGMSAPSSLQALQVLTRQPSADANDGDSENHDASASSDIGDGAVITEGSAASEPRRVKKKLFGKKRQGDASGIGGGGVMDAETLGLPEEVGRLRDAVKSKIGARSSRLHVIRALAGFLENVAAALAKLGSGLRQLLDEIQVPASASATRTTFNISTSLPWSPSSAVDVAVAMKDEAPALRTLWNEITGVLERESKSALALAATLRSLRGDKLDRAILYGDKAIKAATDLDDALWKQLCDSARHQSKTETRYRQVSAQSAKMRERVKSQDSDPGSKAGLLKNKKEPSMVNKHVSKSIANMFSILPDGGAEALKMFAPGARATIAAHSLEEADTRESNRRQQLDAAVEATAKCLESYKSTASSLVKQYDDDDAATLEDMRFVVSGVASAVVAGLDARRSSIAPIGPLSCDFEYLNALQIELQTKLDSPSTDRTAGDVVRTLKDEFGAILATAADMTNSAGESNDGSSVAGASSSSRSDDAGRGTPDQAFSFDTDDGDGDSGWKHGDASSPQKSVATTGSEVFRHSTSGLDASPNRSATTGKLSLETEVFLSAFWLDTVDRSKVSQVKESYACSFRDSSHRLPTLYGRVFVTTSRIIFNSWTGRKLNVAWSDLKSIECVASGDENSILLTCRKSDIEDMYSILGGFDDRSQVLECINGLRCDASRSIDESTSLTKAPPPLPSLEQAAPVPPDATLKKMSVVLSRKLKGISVQRFYEVAWSEEVKPFYEQWLSRVCFDITLGPWQLEPTVGPWCGESYDQKRTVTFKVKRRTHLYIGPPIANVKQTHYCRREGKDKCVLGMTVEFEGMPYCDTFRVEVRWVARRDGDTDVQVDVGVVVDFQKNTLLKSKIQAGTIEETTPVQRNLFEAIKAACIAAGGQDVETMIEEDEIEVKGDAVEVKEPSTAAAAPILQSSTVLAGFAMVALYLMWRVLFRRAQSTVEAPILTESPDLQHLSRRMDDLEVEIKVIQSTLAEMMELLKTQRQESGSL